MAECDNSFADIADNNSINMIVCELLCYLKCKLGRLSKVQLKSIISDFYSSDDITQAKKILLDSVDNLGINKWPKPTKWKNNENNSKTEVNDIFNVFAFVNENLLMDTLPKYVAINVENLPSARLEEGDLRCVLLNKLDLLDTKLDTLSANITPPSTSIQPDDLRSVIGKLNNIESHIASRASVEAERPTHLRQVSTTSRQPVQAGVKPPVRDECVDSAPGYSGEERASVTTGVDTDAKGLEKSQLFPGSLQLTVPGCSSTWKVLMKVGFKNASRNVLEVFQRSLECEYDLLDVLRHESVLTRQQHESLWNECRSRNKRITRLMGYLKAEDRSKFFTALRKSNQSHLANFLERNGVQPVGRDKKDWPLSDYHRRPLQKIYQYLVNDIHTESMLDLLYQEGCISLVQKGSIDRNNRTIQEKNRELIDVIMRRSIQQYEHFRSALKEIHPHLESMLQTFADSKTDIELVQVLLENLPEVFNEMEFATRFMEQSKTDMKLKEYLQPLTENGIHILNIDVAGKKLNVIFAITPGGASGYLKSLVKSNELNSILEKGFKHLLKKETDHIFYDSCHKSGWRDGASEDIQEYGYKGSHIVECCVKKKDWIRGIVDDGDLYSSKETYQVLNVNAQSHGDLVSSNVESEQYKSLLQQSIYNMKMKKLKVSLKLMEKTEDENSQNQDILLPVIVASENDADVVKNIEGGVSELQRDYDVQEEALRTTSPKEIIAIKQALRKCSVATDKLKSDLESSHTEKQQLIAANLELSNRIKELEDGCKRTRLVVKPKQRTSSAIRALFGRMKMPR